MWWRKARHQLVARAEGRVGYVTLSAKLCMLYWIVASAGHRETSGGRGPTSYWHQASAGDRGSGGQKEASMKE